MEDCVVDCLEQKSFNYTLKCSVVSHSLGFIKLWFNFEQTNSCMSGYYFSLFL
uniref:Uncharacterized protein n=1 Tax=Picea sitchensis TaxID=3332 RepID=A9NQV0_PICSI|nr:unknown [Picea sitchensis]